MYAHTALVRFNLSLDITTREKLARLAEQKNVSMNKLIRVAVENLILSEQLKGTSGGN